VLNFGLDFGQVGCRFGGAEFKNHGDLQKFHGRFWASEIDGEDQGFGAGGATPSVATGVYRQGHNDEKTQGESLYQGKNQGFH